MFVVVALLWEECAKLCILQISNKYCSFPVGSCLRVIALTQFYTSLSPSFFPTGCSSGLRLSLPRPASCSVLC